MAKFKRKRRNKKQDEVFDAIHTALSLNKLGYKITAQEVYEARKYEAQIEKEGEWNDD